MTKSQFLGALAATVLMATPAFAAEATVTETSILPVERDVKTLEEAKPSIALMVGTLVPDEGGVATRNFGMDIMFQPRIPFSFGLEAAHAAPESRITGDKMEQTTVLAKAQYNFGGTIPVIRSSYVAVGAGVQFQEADTQFAAAPIIGFDIPFRDEAGNFHVSLGANAKYLYVEGNEEVDSNATSLNGVVKFWY